jgi:hypothetical protein
MFILAIVAFLSVDMSAASLVGQAPTQTGTLEAIAFGVFVFGAVLATTHPTLLDYAKTLDENDKVVRIIEMLNDTNEILDDAVALEGNLLTGHRTTVRTGIPAPTWRKLYGGVQPTKSQVATITDSAGMLEAYAEIDKALADLNGNTAAFRLSESKAIIEGFAQEVAESLFYANEDTEPEAFTGFTPRYNLLSAENGQNIIDAGGTGSDNTSIWLIVWGENTSHLIYPKGSKAGITHEDLGRVTIENIDGAGGRMEGYRDHFRWDIGLTVRDWRYNVRIANIDVSDLVKTAATGADLTDLMTMALEAVEGLGAGRPVFYVGRKVRSFLRRQMISKVGNSTLTMEQLAGKHVLMFDGVPVRRTDALVLNEARVV